MEGVPRAIQLVAGRTAQAFNKRQRRTGAFWEKRYTATAVESGEHLGRCLLYIDLNMVRAKVVKHPKDWKHSGYHEIVRPKKQDRLIDRKKLVKKLDIEPNELPKQYEAWVKQALKQGNLRRNAVWTSSLAAGSEAFADKIKRRLGNIKQHGPKLLNGPDHALREDFGLYGEVLNNKFDWEIVQNKSNDING
jgi:putative transposase